MSQLLEALRLRQPLPTGHARAAMHYGAMLAELRDTIAQRRHAALQAIAHLQAAVAEADRSDAALPTVEGRIEEALSTLRAKPEGLPC